MTRATFGRRIMPPTEGQRAARAAAIGFGGLFVAAMVGALIVGSDGLRVLLVVLAFCSLFAGMAAASEA
jgi:uncharacterized membrane protein